MAEHQAPTAPTNTVVLIEPSLLNLQGFEEALARGWSPDPRRQQDKVSAEAELEMLRHDRAGFLSRLISSEVIATSVSNRAPQYLAIQPFWIWDGDFCGYITLRHLPGTTRFPLHVPGHVGYSIVPWKQGRGYATQALLLLLPIAAKTGLARITVICNENNLASRRVIEKAGGMLQRTGTDPSDSPDITKLFFDLPTTHN
ncbi:GNAT family N-acetyltransferase [Rhizobium sp. SG570]|uniref:GNAT family N-acetyltransferase n=1 Tax=Rhizobium sp. SG570 TaxID=2587113 RepID=UPI001446CD75|nr:GNAT family N-acetyltransferase [Rhizobium sp. SG570]NKJ38197.1 putative acetyltransferase [Rhizobium sp. SG570]